MKDFVTALKAINDDPDEMERVARRMAVARGRDPDEYVSYPNPNGYAVNHRRPYWMNVREELQEAAATVLTLVEAI